jgi:hypothetical protein
MVLWALDLVPVGSPRLVNSRKRVLKINDKIKGSTYYVTAPSITRRYLFPTFGGPFGVTLDLGMASLIRLPFLFEINYFQSFLACYGFPRSN